MIRIALTLALTLAAPVASAWEVGREGALCTLTHDEDGASVRLTFDPGVPLYTIAVSGTGPWPVAALFSMSFDGPQPNTIRTDRHVLSPDRDTLSVADRGFGNVLDGLQYNVTARAVSGAQVVTFSLEGAGPEVAAFRACGQTPSV
ncbi:hypothetical protein KUL25_11465 [Rhodobacteraceae bacterium N5(2021)]|uniref:Excinuclease ABC subunit B n=1 Tax=Gymnodinialimonas phycosphaerae TaxID=2841589 RepID=A0A975TRL5_9RHOB|nr:hypothetical protein [Gymnodinialimonas phycosphaerae]MBY4893382.1 hypothetical protein [Gymnodinialimonas phycosphaerae]